eukprot:766489-Hanusia_phi.AAC.3
MTQARGMHLNRSGRQGCAEDRQGENSPCRDAPTVSSFPATSPFQPLWPSMRTEVFSSLCSSLSTRFDCLLYHSTASSCYDEAAASAPAPPVSSTSPPPLHFPFSPSMLASCIANDDPTPMVLPITPPPLDGSLLYSLVASPDYP